MGSDDSRFVALRIDRISGRRLEHPKADAPHETAVVDAGGVDGWGRSQQVRRVSHAVIGPLYRWWFRFEWGGLDRIPSSDGALLVANHAGAVPIDATLMIHGIEEELGRAVYALHHHRLRAVPFVGLALVRNGGVVAHPDNPFRLLHDERQLVLVFPEGAKGTTKPFRDGYRLARFGRGGFVETAMRAGVPVVPRDTSGGRPRGPASSERLVAALGGVDDAIGRCSRGVRRARRIALRPGRRHDAYGRRRIHAGPLHRGLRGALGRPTTAPRTTG
jgi:1-acyl-sn-glycerol-3-phosphate acyltransferase